MPTAKHGIIDCANAMSHRKCCWPCKRARPSTQIAVRTNFRPCAQCKLQNSFIWHLG